MNKTRTSFRPRKLEINKQLEIITDPEIAFDVMAESESQNSAAGVIADAEEALKQKEKSQQDIPIPVVIESATYQQDYLPTFREKTVYIRGKGGTGHADPTFVEYDLDGQDEAWLEKLNRGQDRLPLDRFEFMIWRLETTNAAAIERTLTAAGADRASRSSAAAVSSTDYMSAEDAVAAMQSGCPCRDRTAKAVYDYWLAKRMSAGRPLLRSLQAATSASDNNWLATFRPREKIHRPQTRRRKEAPGEALEKMRAMRQNLLKSRELIESLTRRERKKGNITCVEIDAHQLQLNLRHLPRASADKIEADYLAHSRSKMKRPLGFEGQTGLAPGGVMPTEGPLPDGGLALLQPHEYKRPAKRKRDPLRPQLEAVAHLPPPPHALEVTFGMLAVECEPDLERLAASYSIKYAAKTAAISAAQASAAAAAAVSTRSGAPAAAAAAAAASGVPSATNGGTVQAADGQTGSGAALDATTGSALNIGRGLGLLFSKELWECLKSGSARLRPSRNGRIVVDRCHPVTYEALDEESDPLGEVVPMHQLPNPYINGSLKSITIRNAPMLTGPQGSMASGGLVRTMSRKGSLPVTQCGSGTPAAAAASSGPINKGRGPGRPPKGSKGGSPME